MLDRWNLTPGGYYLVACRIEPENNIDRIVEEFIASGSERELVIAGGMNFETPYWVHLQEHQGSLHLGAGSAGPRCLLPRGGLPALTAGPAAASGPSLNKWEY